MRKNGYPWWSNLIGYVFWAAVLLGHWMPFWLPVLTGILGITIALYWMATLVIVS